MTRHEMAKQYAGDYYGIAEQAADESDQGFVERVVGTLRASGHVIEAHEVNAGARYDDDSRGTETVMDGLFGAAAMALPQNRALSERCSNPYRRVGDEIAAGAISRHPRPEMTPEMAILAVTLFGSR